MRGLCLALAAFALHAQSPAPRAAFEAASIKPADPDANGWGWNTSPGRITIRNMTLRDLVMFAYDVKDYQVEGGPKWIGNDRYTIVAKLESGSGPVHGKAADERLRLATQSLLADRFRLKFHDESRPMPGYGIVVAKTGFKLKPVDRQQPGGSSWGPGKATINAGTLEEFASVLASNVERPVADETRIAGRFDFKLEWRREDTDSTRPSLFSAVEEQLGLKLEGRHLPVRVLVIDSAEKPALD